MIPQLKPSKSDITFAKGFDTIAAIMGKYLKRFEVNGGKEEAFAEAFWSGIMQMALIGERIIFPHNLGYMQALEHQYERKEKAHLLKFGNLDYSMVWVRHPLFFHHRIRFDKGVHEKVKELKLNGARFLNDYVDGDAYVEQAG